MDQRPASVLEASVAYKEPMVNMQTAVTKPPAIIDVRRPPIQDTITKDLFVSDQHDNDKKTRVHESA